MRRATSNKHSPDPPLLDSQSWGNTEKYRWARAIMETDHQRVESDTAKINRVGRMIISRSRRGVRLNRPRSSFEVRKWRERERGMREVSL